ncbi:MAG: NAD(P)/FAD-dependent oxidoreductase [Nitrososphaerota archaeon]|nr:NAD(P)/FAD-dependent oxidoreductase [Nitrososphaerota archaeon]MDG7024256.1 NAD(P)/FAD-dependent oxidoreductase [Nitrososphaerota archaeon]
MTKVCVVGGGTAGLQAAAEASRLGSDVTVVEKEEPPDLPWRDLPDLIRPLYGSPRPPPAPPRSAAVRVLTSGVTSCEAGLVRTSGGDERCDRVVLATGSAFEPPTFRGSWKPGVYLLDSQRSYHDLGRDSGPLERAVVAGEGGRSLEVADRLAGGRSIVVVISHWQGGRPSRPVFDAISEAAKERRISITSGVLTDAVGTGRVEAAVVEGAVLPCDSVVFVPRRLPRVPATGASLGRTGAVLVGRNLAAGVPGTFAAGGCAEVEGVGPPSTLAGEPSSSGRIAGANCLGGGLSLGPTWSAESLLFGLRWVRTKSRQTGARRPCDRAAVRRTGKGAACEIVYDRQSGRVNEIEFITAISSRVACEVPPSPDLNLRALAYGGTGSSDISLVSETARLGLVR